MSHAVIDLGVKIGIVNARYCVDGISAVKKTSLTVGTFY